MSPSKVPMSVLAALGLVAVEGCTTHTPSARPCLNIMVEPSDTEGDTPAPVDDDGASPDDDEPEEPAVGPCLEYVPDWEPDTDNDPKKDPPADPPPEPPLGPCLSPLPPPQKPVESPHEPAPGPCLRMMPEPREEGPVPTKPKPGEEGEDPEGAVLERGVLPADVADLLRSRKG